MKAKKHWLISLFLLPSLLLQGQYYDFPFPGWKQTLTSFVWTGVHTEIGITHISFDRDTILDGTTYVGNEYSFFRNEDGKLFQNVYDWQTQTYSEQLEYDFSLEEGDYFTNYLYEVDDSMTVVKKERIVNQRHNNMA